MKFAYKPDHTVTGYNRAATEGTDELTGTCTPQHWNVTPPEHSTDVRFYTEVSGVPVAKSQTEINAIITVDEKLLAVSNTIELIEEKKRKENLKDFPYDGNTYVSDQESIQATQNECLGADPLSDILTLRGTLHEGSWATVNGFVKYTCGEFILFATEYFKRGSDNFTTRSLHKMAIEAMEQDASKTAADILAYDYSTGWH